MTDLIDRLTATATRLRKRSDDAECSAARCRLYERRLRARGMSLAYRRAAEMLERELTQLVKDL